MPFLQGLNFLFQGLMPLLLCRVKKPHQRGLVAVARLHAGIGSLIEKGVKLVVFLLGDGVVFMLVTLTALHGQS